MASEGNGVALAVGDLAVNFGGVVAVDHVSLEVRRGLILGLIGPNGAGKTTLFDGVCGTVAASGTVKVDGVDVTGRAPYLRARAGLGRSYQDGRLFPSLLVPEAIAVALERHSDRVGPVNALFGVGPSRSAERKVGARVEELLELLGLLPFRERYVSELSTGTRRIVDLACVLAHSPSVLLLDEPSSGIAQREAEALAPVLLRIRDELGCTMLLIEHDMPLVTSVADELLALDTGRVVTRGAPEAVLRDPTVISAYLGGNEAAVRRSGAREIARRPPPPPPPGPVPPPPPPGASALVPPPPA